MGAITRAAANNITTSGIILPAGINDASVASITALSQVSAGDGITLISSGTGTGTANITFTNIDNTYKTYLFTYINLHPSTDSDYLRFNLSTNNGSDFSSVTKTSTAFFAYHAEADNDAGLSYKNDGDLAQSTDYQRIHDTGSASADNDHGISGHLYLFNPSSTTYVKHWMTRTSDPMNWDAAGDYFTAGYANTTSAINAVNFQFNAGNIDAGTIHLYGIA